MVTIINNNIILIIIIDNYILIIVLLKFRFITISNAIYYELIAIFRIYFTIDTIGTNISINISIVIFFYIKAL